MLRCTGQPGRHGSCGRYLRGYEWRAGVQSCGRQIRGIRGSSGCAGFPGGPGEDAQVCTVGCPASTENASWLNTIRCSGLAPEGALHAVEAGGGIRTRDNLLGRQGLCQLSYTRIDPRFRVGLSGREDLNLRPQRPKRCALPDCATPRHRQYSQTANLRQLARPASERPRSLVSGTHLRSKKMFLPLADSGMPIT
jgi:hypothetical protein